MYDRRVQPHLRAGPTATAAALQLDACIPDVLLQEPCPFRVPEHVALVDARLKPRVKKGRLANPERPTLGVKLIEERVALFLRTDLKLSA